MHQDTAEDDNDRKVRECADKRRILITTPPNNPRAATICESSQHTRGATGFGEPGCPYGSIWGHKVAPFGILWAPVGSIWVRSGSIGHHLGTNSEPNLALPPERGGESENGHQNGIHLAPFGPHLSAKGPQWVAKSGLWGAKLDQSEPSLASV